MGICHSESNYCHVNWNFIKPHLYQNKITGQLIQHQQIAFSQQQQLRLYQHRLKLIHSSVVRLIYFQVNNKNYDLCENRNKKVDIFIQGKIQRRNNLLKNKCCCKEIRNGFNFLKKHYGSFKVTMNNIWFKQGKIRVWICQDPYLNSYKPTSQKQMNQNINSVLSQFYCYHDRNNSYKRQFVVGQSNNINNKQTICRYKNRLTIQQSDKFYPNTFQTLQSNNSGGKINNSIKSYKNALKNRVNFSYLLSNNNIYNKFNNVDRNKQQYMIDDLPKLKDFNEIARTNVGTQSDRTHDISLGKSKDNIINKTIQQSPKRKMIQQIIIQSDKNMSSGKQNGDELVNSEDERIFQQKIDKIQKKIDNIQHLKIKTSKILQKRYLSQDQSSYNKSFSNQIDLITKQKQWSLNQQLYISEQQQEALQTKSVFIQQQNIKQDLIAQNKSGLIQIQMFQDHKKTLVQQMELLFKLYQPQQDQQKHIKKKVQQKRANFAQLKEEAGKILGNEWF